MSNQEQVNEIISCLQKTYTSTNNKEREIAEKKLSEYENLNLINYIQVFLSLITSSNSNLDNNIKLSIISMLNRVIKKSIENNINSNKRNEIITQYIDTIITPNLNIKFIENLLLSLSNLLNETQDNPEILNLLIISIEKNINNIQTESYYGLISVLNSVSLSLGLSIKNYQKVVKSINNISKILFENILKKTSIINETNYKYLSELFAKLFNLLSNLIFRLRKRLKRNENEILIEFIPFIPIAFQLLVNPNDNLRIISWTGNNEIDLYINKLKISIIKYLNKIADNFPTLIDSKEKDLINNHIELLKIIILDLEWVINNKIDYVINLDDELNNKYPDNEYSNIIYYSLFYLNNMFTKDNFRVAFERNLQNIFKNILLPFLIISNNEVSLIESNDEFENYASLIEDIIENNKSKTIKSSVSLLIKNFYNYSSLSSFILKYIFILIGNSFGLNLENMNNLSNDVIDLILKNNNIKKVDIGLLVLCIISKKKQTEENAKLIKTFYNQISSFLLYPNLPTFITYKNILLIKELISDLYEIYDDEFQELLKYLLSNMFMFQKVIISSTSAETLSNIMENIGKNDFNYISEIFVNIIPQLMNNILNTSYNNFFNVLLEITLKLNDSELKEFQAQMFTSLCKRILLETEKKTKVKFKVIRSTKKNQVNQIEDNNNNQTFLINKCFNIIRVLMEKKIFVQTHYEIIEESLFPLIKYLDESKTIEFDEDLVLILTKMINYKKQLSKITKNALQFLYKYAEKNEGMLLDLFELVNNYIIYGMKEIESNSILFKSLINIFNCSMNTEKFVKSPFYACCLIQIWIMNSNSIEKEVIIQFIDYSLQQIKKLFELKISKNIDDKAQFEEEHYNYIAFIVLFYSTFIHYSNITLNEIKKLNCENFIEQFTILLYKIEFFSQYQVKLLILCLCYLINNDIFIFDYKKMLSFIFNLLIIQKKNEVSIINKEMRKELKCNFVEEEESEEEYCEDNQFEDYDDKAEIRDLVSRIINPLKDEDEFKIFKNTIDNFTKKNPNLFNEWDNSLNNIEKNTLNKILNTIRINLSVKDKNYSVPRKIVTIKRNNK